MRIGDLVDEACAKLRSAGVGQPATDARRLAEHALGLDHAGIIAAWRDPVDAAAARGIEAMVARRAGGEPVSRIVGYREFFGLRFDLSPAVLDPRPETELLVDRALADFGGRGPMRFCDLCAGSGAIGIALLSHMPESRCVAADISAPALAMARHNAQLNGVAARYETWCGNYFDGLEGRFDFIVANPPYIATRAIDSLQPEVRHHDPLLALDGGEDGLFAYRVLFAKARHRLRDGGRIYVELGAGQSRECAGIARSHGWRVVSTVRDHGGIRRLLVAEMGMGPEAQEVLYEIGRKCLESDREQDSFPAMQG